MRKIAIVLLLILVKATIGQNIVFHENFEAPSLADSLQTSGSQQWAITNQFASSGINSDSSKIINPLDSAILTTLSFSTLGYYQIYLNFQHICKVEYNDGGFVEVSGDNGNTWIRLQANHYMGNGQFATNGSKFSSITYTDWLPQTNSATPNSSWWRSEKFNVSAFLANKANAKIRFVLKDVNGNGGNNNYGWMIDDIKVSASIGEMAPPNITMISYPQGNIYTNGPYKIEALITDSSGIDTAQVIYTINNSQTYTLTMQNVAGDTFRAFIPFYGYGTNICFKIKTKDGSYFANEAYFPSQNSCQQFTVIYSTGGTYTVGTGIGTNGTSSTPSPYAHYWTGNRSQYLIKASELTSAGASAGNISSVAFNVLTPDPPSTSGSNPTNSRCKNYTIKLKNTSSNSLSNTYETGLTTVYTHPNYGSTVGWNTHNFSNQFAWDGISNLIVEICFDNYINGSDYSNNAVAYLTNTSFVSATYFESDDGGVCNQSTGYTLYSRPNMKFNFLNPVLTRDVGVIEIDNPSSVITANTNYPISVKVKNYGSDTITSFHIGWKINGVIQPTIYWTGVLLQDSISQSIIIDTLSFAKGQYQLEIWTINPNGNFDYNTINDYMSAQIYACSSPLSGNYTIGGANSDYNTLSEAVAAIANCGISGQVNFDINPGIYNEQIKIGSITGSSIANSITFKSTTNDSNSVIIQFDATDSIDNYIIMFDGASDIIFKHLTFKSLDSNFANIIQFKNSNQRIELANNRFIALAGYLSNQNRTIIKAQESNIEQITFINNYFENGYNGIYLNQNTLNSYPKNIKIIGNIFLDQINQSIDVNGIENIEISSNTFSTNYGFINYKGLKTNRLKGIWKVNNNVFNILSANIIVEISNTENTTNQKALIFNNLINAQGDIENFIRLENSSNLLFAFNSLNLQSSKSCDLLKISKALGTSENVEIFNNIFKINGSNGYIINFDFNPNQNNYQINHNNYYSGTINQIKSENQTFNFSDWQISKGFDINSLEVNPYFVSNTNLHISNNNLSAAGKPLSQITYDLDNQTRKTNTPTIGCYEMTSLNYDLGIISFSQPTSKCGKDSLESIKIKIKNYGTQNINNGITAKFKVEPSNNWIAENISSMVNSGDTIEYEFSNKINLSAANMHRDSIFKINFSINCNSDSTHYNDSLSAEIVSLYKPTPPITNTFSTSYGTSTILTANSNDSIFWYSSANSTQEISSGKFYTTPILYDTLSYWVTAKGTIGGNYAIGTSNNTNATNGYPAPYSNYSGGAKHQMLIRSSELKAKGIKKGYIQSIGLEVTNIGADFDGRLQNFRIDMGNTTQTQLSSTQFISGLTEVSTYKIATIQPGITNHKLDKPFYWDGNSNIVIQLIFNNLNTGSTNKTVQTKQTDAGFISSIWYVSNSYNIAQLEATTTPLSSSTWRPNMNIELLGNACESDKEPIQVNITNYPINDAGITQIISPIDTVTFGQSTPLLVELKNFGLANLTNVQIKWSLNNSIPDSMQWQGILAKDSIANINLGNLSLIGGQNCIKIWTELPNNQKDSISSNDTILNCVYACFNGTYTIGKTSTNQYDFQDFNSAINAISAASICGHIIFLVDSGTYNERLILPIIATAGANQQITFKSMYSDSSLVKISFATTSTLKSVINILGSFYNFEGITISASNGGTVARVIEIAPNAHDIKFESCQIIGKTTTSASNNFTNIFAQGVGIFNIKLLNNYIYAGSYPIYLYGTGTSISTGNQIIGNKIIDFYYFGPHIYYTDSLIFESNHIKNIPSNTYVYGVYFSYNSSFKITKNHFQITGYSQTYGLRIQNCTSPTTSPGLIANNFLSLNGTGTSSWYGYHLQSIVNMNFIYNSTRMMGGGSTAATLYVSGGSGLQFINNNLTVGLGSGYPAYIATPASITYSDHNNYYSSGANIIYWNGAKTNLSSLISASFMDSNSVSIAPNFVSNTDLHLISNTLSAKGLWTNQVIDDFDNQPRTSTPTIGAHEVPVIPFDGGILEIIYPSLTTEGIAYPLYAVVKNFGINSLSSFSINYIVNNGNISNFIYNQTLLSGQTDTVLVTNLTSPAGQSKICMFTQILNDSNYFNDSLCVNFFGNPGFDLNLIKALPIATHCGMQTDSLKIEVTNSGNQNITNSFTIKYEVNENNSIISQTVNQSIPIGDTVILTFNTPIDFTVNQTDSVFNIKTWVELLGDNIQYNDSGSLNLISYHTPSLPIVNHVIAPYGGNAILTASTSNNDILHWFTDSLNGIKLGQGNTYQHNLVLKDTSFWVEASSGQNTNIQIGNATTSNAFNNYPAPYTNYYGGAKHQILIRAEELLMLGIMPNQIIDSISFEVSDMGPLFSGTLNNFRLDLGLTTDSMLSSTSFISNLTNVVGLSNFDVKLGTNTHKTNMPFAWDGVSNLVVQTSYSNGNNGITDTYVTMKHTVTNFQSCNYYRVDGAPIQQIYNANTPTASTNKRPNMHLYFSAGGCTTARVKSTITISNPPSCDLGIINILKPQSAIGLTDKEAVQVEIKNFGTAAQSNYYVHYQINNGQIKTDTILQPILPFANFIYKLRDSADLQIPGAIYTIKAWVTTTCDTLHFNDTLQKTVQNLISNYCTAHFTTGTGYGDYINRVKLNTLDNYSGGTSMPSYINYGNMGNVFLTTNNSYELIVHHGIFSSNNYVAAWIDLNRDGDFNDLNEKLGEVYMNSASTNIDTIKFAIPSDAIPGKTRLRVRTVYDMFGLDPCADYTWGETEDYEITIIEQLSFDLGIIDIISPKMHSSQSSYKFKIALHNNGSDSIYNFSVYYKLNSNPTVINNFNGIIKSGDTAHYEFNTTIPPYGKNEVLFFVSNGLDLNPVNDQLKMIFYKIPTLEPPYFDNFDVSDLWYPDSLNMAWERGIPGGSVIQNAYSQPNVLMTDLNNNYQNNSNYYIYSPYFDLTKIQADSVVFWHNFHSEPLADYCVLQYMTSLGWWYDLGVKNDTFGTNWYNTQFGQAGWTGNSQGWTRSSYDLSKALFIAPITQFRFALLPNLQNNFYDGWAIDNFELTVAPTQIDAGLIGIENIADTTQSGDILLPIVKFKNFGTDTLTQLHITVKINNGQSITETWTGALAPNDSSSYSFTGHLNSIQGSHRLLASINLQGDIYKYNDTISKKIFGLGIQNDLGIKRLEPNNISQNPLIIKCLVENFGQDPVSNFIVEFKLNGNVISTNPYLFTLLPGDSALFIVKDTSLNYNNYQVCASILNNSSDLNLNNNSKCQNVLISNIKNIEKPKWQLYQNIPNPSNNTTDIHFNLHKAGNIDLKVYNIFGEILWDFSGFYPSGINSITIDTRGLASGLYFYTMSFDHQVQTKKMQIQK